ncbi:hypothetical protein WA026_017696 [Henosepilachna vigintioctopunctata]|uniref:Uncharacterized protein n=1 Tax=Henosepilachna vigintioctopunctata TaxID=420089 RepID=A0AAW1UDH7_9CUCU
MRFQPLPWGDVGRGVLSCLRSPGASGDTWLAPEYFACPQSPRGVQMRRFYSWDLYGKLTYDHKTRDLVLAMGTVPMTQIETLTPAGRAKSTGKCFFLYCKNAFRTPRLPGLPACEGANLLHLRAADLESHFANHHEGISLCGSADIATGGQTRDIQRLAIYRSARKEWSVPILMRHSMLKHCVENVVKVLAVEED